MVKYCPKCGRACNNDDIFCIDCGFDFKNIMADFDDSKDIKNSYIENKSDGLNKISNSEDSFFTKKNIIIILIAVLIIAISTYIIIDHYSVHTKIEGNLEISTQECWNGTKLVKCRALNDSNDTFVLYAYNKDKSVTQVYYINGVKSNMHIDNDGTYSYNLNAQDANGNYLNYNGAGDKNHANMNYDSNIDGVKSNMNYNAN